MLEEYIEKLKPFVMKLFKNDSTGREDAKEIKPNPEIYLKIMKELQVTKEQCWIFEDSLIGVDAANNAGIDVVAMYDKYSDLERDEIEKKSSYNFSNYKDVIQNLLKEDL